MTDEQPRPVTDLSPRVVSLAREIDRLQPGTYSITVTKPELAALSWHVDISRVETLRTMELAKREVHHP